MVDDDRREKSPSLILGGEIRVYYQGPDEAHLLTFERSTQNTHSQVTELDQASQDLLSHPRWEPFSELHRQRKAAPPPDRFPPN